MAAGMISFFTDMGRKVQERWKLANFSLEAFPALADAVLREMPPALHVGLPDLMREFLLNDDQVTQSQSGFGQPEIVAFHDARFYIQLLFWMDGTTDIHQHEFSGAFHVMHGSSIHALYDFTDEQRVTPHLRVGELRMREIELLEQGRTVRIVSGSSTIHSLFHLDTPSVTVVVRTQHDPGTGPQFNYLPPHVAMDPVHADTLTLRRKQLLDVLEQTESEAYAGLVGEMLAGLDFERGFFILQNSMARLHDLGLWEEMLAGFEQKHGSLAAGVGATLREGVRRDVIKSMRGAIAEPEHRFFLALLMNVTRRADLLALVAGRFPELPAEETVMRWAEELCVQSDEGLTLLDAYFPDGLAVAEEDEAEVLLAALKTLMCGGKKLPVALRGVGVEGLAVLRVALAESSLGPLVG
jgi:predicted metal-dependent enzyme (double-stranded beta helix superfamily)